MQYFYALDFRKWMRWVTIISFALFAAIFIWFERDETFSVFLKNTDESVALTKGNADETNISLTFNISWGEEKVNDILKKLKENQTQATFFVSGEWAERHPDIVKRITEDEHELGMLGYRYKSYLEQEIDQVKKDLHYAKEVFRKLGYDDIKLLRTPSGHFNKDIIELAEQTGFNVIHWNVNPNDWKNPGTQNIVDHVMKEASNGDIILLHASDSVKQTANALSTILPGLKNKGFNYVTITELINQAHAEAEIID